MENLMMMMNGMLVLKVLMVLFVALWSMFLMLAVVLDTECKYRLKKGNLYYYKWTTLSEIGEGVEILGIDKIRIVMKITENIRKLL